MPASSAHLVILAQKLRSAATIAIPKQWLLGSVFWLYVLLSGIERTEDLLLTKIKVELGMIGGKAPSGTRN